jgi:hypothetical protein
MSIEASLLLMFVILLGIPVTAGLGRLVSRILRIGTWLSILLPILFLVALIGGGTLYLDTHGTPITGSVVQKHETIQHDDTGSWRRTISVDVSYQPDGSEFPKTLSLSIDTATYDQLHVGSPVALRYVDLLGIFDFARLAQQSTLSLVPTPIFEAAALGLVAFLLFWAWVKTRSWQGKFLRGLMLAAIWLALVAGVVLLPTLVPASGNRTTGTAQVKEIDHYTQVALSRNRKQDVVLAQPFDMVQLEFVPASLQDPVETVDVIDSGSVKNLEVGGAAQITYPASDPRAAQLVGGTRTHLWKNVFGAVGVYGIAILACFGSLALVGVLWRWFMGRLLFGGRTRRRERIGLDSPMTPMNVVEPNDDDQR